MASLYEALEVQNDVDDRALRAAYRRLAFEVHPDRGGDGERMAQLNEAWAVLSDPQRRRRYDATLGAGTRASATPESPTGSDAGAERNRQRPVPPRMHPGWRRRTWFSGLQLQIRRLSTQAARSAVQTLLIRHHGIARDDCDALVDPIVDALLQDTEERVRAARKAGAAPLDLAIGAALLGLHVHTETLLVTARRTGRPSVEATRIAEMLDRMWDTMAHEIPHELAHALGGNPRAARRLRA